LQQKAQRRPCASFFGGLSACDGEAQRGAGAAADLAEPDGPRQLYRAPASTAGSAHQEQADRSGPGTTRGAASFATSF